MCTAGRINTLSYSGTRDVSTYTQAHIQREITQMGTYLYTQGMCHFILLQKLFLVCTFLISALFAFVSYRHA